MKNLRGKKVVVTIYQIGTSKILRKVAGKCKSIHTAHGIRDSSWIEVVDKNGNKIPTILNVLREYEVIEEAQ